MDCRDLGLDLFGKGGPILLVPSGLLNLLSSLVCAEHLVLPSSFAFWIQFSSFGAILVWRKTILISVV